MGTTEDLYPTMASPLIKTVPEVSLISPPPGSVPESSVPLTSFDLPWFNFPPVHRLFFYSSPLPAAPFIESLKSSLSLTLQHFYTLAGRVCLSPDSNDNRIDIQYKDGNNVRFTVAESDCDFNELATGTKREYSTQIHPLLPQQSGLLAVQVTVFPGHGICIGFTIPHVAGDGSSTVRFFKSWASACRSGALAGTPIYDRSLITEIPGYYSQLYKNFVQSRPVRADEASPSPGVVLALFTLGRDKIERLKQRVREHDEHTHCSTFVVSSAHAWVCFVRTRRCFSNYLTAHFLIAVDCRRRLDPAVPDSYFGNCLRPCLVEESVGVLKDEDGVLAACLEIGKAVEGLKAGIMRGAEEWRRKLKAIEHETMLSVAGSPKLGVYDVDFGWGKPARVEVPSIMKTGAISLAETRKGDGGIEIGIALEKGEIDEFETKFYGDV